MPPTTLHTFEVEFDLSTIEYPDVDFFTISNKITEIPIDVNSTIGDGGGIGMLAPVLNTALQQMNISSFQGLTDDLNILLNTRSLIQAYNVREQLLTPRLGSGEYYTRVSNPSVSGHLYDIWHLPVPNEEGVYGAINDQIKSFFSNGIIAKYPLNVDCSGFLKINDSINLRVKFKDGEDGNHVYHTFKFTQVMYEDDYLKPGSSPPGVDVNKRAVGELASIFGVEENRLRFDGGKIRVLVSGQDEPEVYLTELNESGDGEGTEVVFPLTPRPPSFV
jgi:hypothetical protein